MAVSFAPFNGFNRHLHNINLRKTYAGKGGPKTRGEPRASVQWNRKPYLIFVYCTH